MAVNNTVSGTYDWTFRRVVSADNGQFVTLFFNTPINAVAGDAFLAMAAHYGGTETAGFELAGQLAQGAVAGTDETIALVSLLNPSAPMVRMLMHDFTTVDETTVNERFEVYPNPAAESLNVTLTLTQSENTVIDVLDITGKVVKTINLGTVNGDKNLIVSLDEMTSGIYFIQLVNADGKQMKKFVKK